MSLLKINDLLGNIECYFQIYTKNMNNFREILRKRIIYFKFTFKLTSWLTSDVDACVFGTLPELEEVGNVPNFCLDKEALF
jgi:hypothetical protein